MSETYDYVIVGAGSAGCVLASRLSEDRATTVLLLEAGPDLLEPLGSAVESALRQPELFQLMQDSLADWRYQTEPQAALGERRMGIPRGRIVGGSSTLMAGMAIRGHRLDFDDWARESHRRWCYREVLPYFKKLESNRGATIEPEYHGSDGPLVVSDLPVATPAGRAFLEAAQGLGYPFTKDFNGSCQEGVGNLQSYQDGGVRVSSASAYLTTQVRSRPNLTIEARALATAVRLERCRGRLRARGLAYESHRDGRRVAKTVEARREVLVSCGTLDSPKLLMLSGIGPEPELSEHGIRPWLNLPGVGKNLQEHIVAPVVYAYKEGAAPAAVVGYGVEGGMFWRVRRGRSKPDLQIVFNHALLGPPQTPVVPAAFMVVPLLVNPESRGEVRLGGSLVGSPPRIFGNFLSQRGDLEVLVEGLKIALGIARHPAFDGLRGPRMFPPPPRPDEDPAISDAELRGFVRDFANTLFHPVGTCRMGRSPGDARRPAVVDAELRVHGVDGLRVVDASIMPTITTGNTHTPTTMIAELAAELIRHRHRGERP